MDISFNQINYQRFKKDYQTAVKNRVEVFIFQECEFLTAYAKYVIEYLKPNFEN
jgi:hypothetical protein